MWMGVTYLQSVAELGIGVTVIGVGTSIGYLYCGQAMLGRGSEPLLPQSILLAIVFPSGLILSNARATLEALFRSQNVFVRTPRSGELAAGGWRGRPELVAGLLLPVFALAEQAWSAPFFVFAAAGLLSIGAMGWNGSGAKFRLARRSAPEVRINLPIPASSSQATRRGSDRRPISAREACRPTGGRQ